MKNDKFGKKEAKEYLNSKYPGIENLSDKWVDGHDYKHIQKYSTPEAMANAFVERILNLIEKIKIG